MGFIAEIPSIFFQQFFSVFTVEILPPSRVQVLMALSTVRTHLEGKSANLHAIVTLEDQMDVISANSLVQK